MSGSELKALAISAGLGPVAICHEARISDETLRKVYRDLYVAARTRARVMSAIKRLAAKAKGDVAVAG